MGKPPTGGKSVVRGVPESNAPKPGSRQSHRASQTSPKSRGRLRRTYLNLTNAGWSSPRAMGRAPRP
jgi:hypothetical protein